MKDYVTEYSEFVQKYKFKEIQAEEIGYLIARMANFFIAYNQKLAEATVALARVRRNMMGLSDEATGKPITATKADAMADATEEAAVYQNAKADVTNIDQCINALKMLQRAVSNEYAHAG